MTPERLRLAFKNRDHWRIEEAAWALAIDLGDTWRATQAMSRMLGITVKEVEAALGDVQKAGEAQACTGLR